MPTLVRGGIVLPMSSPGARLEPGSVLIDGRDVVAVGDTDSVERDPRAVGAEIVDAAGCAVLPGLHNCHLHSGLLRGTAESLSLWDWLKAYVDPAHRALTPEIAAAASLQCYAESVLAGTTSVMDMWRFMEGSAAAAGEIGIRATLVPYVADEQGYDYFESIDSNRRLLESHRTAADGRVRTWVGLEHLFYCTPRSFEAALALMEEFDTGLHTHSSESIWEVQESPEAVREPAPRGLLPTWRPVGSHGRRPLRVARRPGDPAAGPHRHRRRPLPVLQHEAVVGPGAGGRHAGGRRRGRPGQRRREGEQQPRPASRR